jgi:hypothetical protein
MAITDLRAHMKTTDVAQSTSRGGETDGLHGNIAALEAEFRLLREECVRTRNLIEDREQKGRTLIEAYKHVISDFTDLFEAQRKENQKRDESVRFLLSSVETRIKADLERMFASETDDLNVGNQERWGLFRRKS